MRVYLAGRDPQGLAAYAKAVSDPHSATFHHYLTPAQVRSRFGGTAAQTEAVTSWLSASGLKVDKVTDHYVSVRGSVASAQKAFGVTLHDYTVEKATLRAPAGDVTVPAAVAPDVLGGTGLDNGKHQASPAESLPSPPTITVRAAPCSSYYGQKQATDEPPAYGHTGVWTQCGDTPQQIRSVYGLDKVSATGNGSTVAVVDAFASPTITSDVSVYTKVHGTAGLKPGQFTQDLPADYNSVEDCGGPRSTGAPESHAANGPRTSNSTALPSPPGRQPRDRGLTAPAAITRADLRVPIKLEPPRRREPPKSAPEFATSRTPARHPISPADLKCGIPTAQRPDVPKHSPTEFPPTITTAQGGRPPAGRVPRHRAPTPAGRPTSREHDLATSRARIGEPGARRPLTVDALFPAPVGGGGLRT